MEEELTGQSAVIVGAAGGIGHEVALLLGEAGVRLHLLDIQDTSTTRKANEGVPNIESVQHCDVSQRTSVAAIARALGQVEILVDAAGIWPRDDWMADDWDTAFDRVMDVNVRGPINLVRAFLPPMMQRRYGRIVLCGSIAGWTGGLMSSPHYVAAKGGVHALVRWFSQLGAPHRVCVNGVAPGPVSTGMTHDASHDLEKFPLKRIASPREVAHAMAFLCSPGASFVSGSILDVNGGIHMR